jgi:hypothetical protein
MKAKNGKCEGAKAYGKLPGEAETLQLILESSASGNPADVIAARLNGAEIKSRSGRPWRASVIRKILKRNREGVTA